MATVYHAFDPSFARDVAIKVLPREFLHDPNFHARFEREAQIIASLEHPAIVPVYDFGESDGLVFIVMRLMPGNSLADRLEAGRLSLSEVTRIITQVADALDEAHRRGIIHRDLKPANILFDNHQNPYISDFGLAKQLEGSALTVQGGIMGTPSYMSPEQARGSQDLDSRSDIYSLGVILYEMLTGKRPYYADYPLALALKHVTDPVPNPLVLRSDLPEEYQLIVACAMAKVHTDRYRTAGVLAQDLQTVLPLITTTRKKTDLKFLAAWIGVTTLGYILWFLASAVMIGGVALANPAMTFENLSGDLDWVVTIMQPLVTLVAGLLLGVLQALLLRGRIQGTLWWVAATPFTLPGIIVLACAPTFTWLIGYLGQWLILRRQVQNAIWWVLAGGVTWVVNVVLLISLALAALGILFVGLQLQVVKTITQEMSIAIAFGILAVAATLWGLVEGTVTGLVMMRFLNQRRSLVRLKLAT
jgi:hypothetical protein